MGVNPDGIVGHSVGELGCGYADGSLTAEETVLGIVDYLALARHVYQDKNT
jgi:malonyl CoA-acyl carrier protein transacylase